MDPNTADNIELENAIAAELDLTGMSGEEKREIISHFGEVALQTSLLAVLETLTPEKRETFGLLIENENPEELRTFIAKEVPAYDDIARKAVQDLVARFKESQKKAG